MQVLQVRNVQQALPRALQLLEQTGVERPSRNGPVLLGPSVTTVYERPCERVLFHPQRDANPFFHLYESLWMLAGRNDVAGPARYAKQINEYSDDGLTMHGAYGHRWRYEFGRDQLRIITKTLKKDPDDRRCVLQMWEARNDLGRVSKDLPCNTVATLQIVDGALNLAVFCRSNDIVWGAYGANAVHFSFLLEYMALWIGVPVGTYSQISVNWHAYLGIFEQVKDVRPDRMGFVNDPYADGRVHVTPIEGSIERVDELISILLEVADEGHLLSVPDPPDEPWAVVIHYMLQAHEAWRTYQGAERYLRPLEILAEADQKSDWIVAGREWLTRRQLRSVLAGDASHL